MYDEPGQAPSSTSARFRFDEAHTLLNRQVHKGDHIQIVKVGDDQNAYGIDFIELEEELGRKIGLDHSDLTIQGAGMWYTNLRFTSDQAGGPRVSVSSEASPTPFVTTCSSTISPALASA